MSSLKRLLALVLVASLLWTQPAQAQSILRDAETEALFDQMSRPLIIAAGLSPAAVRVVLLQDDEINAFTAGGQTVYVNSGLIQAADNANQVQGVIAHELGHVADGHVILADRASKPLLGMTLLSLVVGIAAMAAGAGDAGAGIMAAGQQAALGKYLAFSRTQEATADATAVKFLRTAGVSGKGMISFFKKLQNEEYAYGLSNIDPYMQTHPLSGDRIAHLTADLQASPSWGVSSDPAMEEAFRRVKAKLGGYVNDYKATLNRYPDTDQSLYAHYARAYAWHKAGYPEKADAEAAALVTAEPKDPYFLEVEGQILLESGRPRDAVVPLRKATGLSSGSPLIATTFGHALIATEDESNYAEAVKVLRAAVARDNDNPFAWYELGTAYEAMGDQPRALLATAERASQNGDDKLAAYAAKGALAGLSPGTSDWLRASDIATTAQNALDDSKGKHRK